MKSRSYFWPSMFVAIFLLTFTVTCRQDQGAWKRIQDNGILRIGLDPTYPPFEFLEENSVAGIDVDLTRSIADELGVNVVFTYFGYDGLYDALATNQVDVLASALVISDDKLRDFVYTTSYFNAGQVLVSNVDSATIDPTRIQKLTLAVELGAQGHVEATQWLRTSPGLEIITYQSVADALGAVSVGEADAALVDHIGARVYIDANDAPFQVSDPVTDDPFSLVVLAGEQELLRVLNESLARLERENELDAILNRWLGS